jgi:heme-degrading monooxygenase HmoA
MFMRIVWGKIAPGKWSEFEAAFKSSMANRGDIAGLKNHWLARDQIDSNAGYSITLWDDEASMQAFWNSQRRHEIMAPLEPFYVNQFTVTNCSVKYSLHG